MTVALPISRIINVSVVLNPALAQAPSFNSMLILGTSTVIDVTERIREYGDLASVQSDFGAQAEESLAATKWFGQAPRPESIQIGRWAKTSSQGQLIGGGVDTTDQQIAGWNAITTGAALVFVDGVPYALSGMNFVGAANMNGVAAIIQATLAAAVAGATVVWSSTYTRFIVTSATTGAQSTVGFFAAPTAIGNYTFAANPSNNDTVTVNGTTVTFKTAGPIVGNQVLVAGNLANTLTALAAFLNDSADANISQASYLATGTKLFIVNKTPGAAGNTFTITASVAVPSGATLTGGAGVDIASKASLEAADGAYVAPGVPAQSAIDTVTLLDNGFANSWYGLNIPSASVQDHLAVANYIDGADVSAPHFYWVTSQDPNEIVPGQTTSLGYLLGQQGNNRLFWQYSSKTLYAAVSAGARILTTDWTGSNTAITLKFKEEPGVEAERLTVSQANALEANRGNVFVSYNNNSNIIEQGICPSGQFVDTVIGVDWLASFIQTNLYNVLKGSTTKIPQTDAGNHVLATSIESSCDTARTNGLLGPGTWNTGGFGQLVEGQFLPKGYYVYAPPIMSQAPADRAARKSVVFQVAAKLAGAIHSADVIVNVNN